MKIICPLRIKSFSEFQKKYQEIAGRADVIELWLNDVEDLDNFLMEFFKWKKYTRPKEEFLAVCKTLAEKGNFQGTSNERVKVLQKFLIAQGDLIDLDVTQNTDQDIKMIPSKVLILSFHDFEKVPENLDDIFLKMQKFNPAIFKFAVTTNSQAELDYFFEFFDNFPKDKKAIFTTMGTFGLTGRIQIGERSWGGFVALNKDEITASGQRTLDDL